MLRALSFIGMGNYQETMYTYGESRVTTAFFPLFILEIFNPDIMNVFITKEVREQKWQEFQDALPVQYKEKVKPVEIPKGASTEELWQIFQTIVTTVSNEENIIMDTTHAFRSIPMLALVAAQYLRATKGVIVKGIYYGAFEARTNNHSPVFNLSPFIELMEWTDALYIFNQTGNASGIAQILREKQNLHHIQKNTEKLPKRLKTFGNWLDAISINLLQLKTRSALKAITHLPQVLQDAENDVQSYVPPLAVVLEQSLEQIIQLGHSEPNKLDVNLLNKERALIRWYGDHGHYLHALGLLREHIINIACLKLQIDNPFHYDTEKTEKCKKSKEKCKEAFQCDPDRKCVESFVRKISSQYKGKIQENSACTEKIALWQSQCLGSGEKAWWKKLSGLFAAIAQLRNRVMHAEIAHDQQSSGDLKQKIEPWINDIEKLMEDAGIQTPQTGAFS